jgi:quercetin dioxygenase-like cupin family protein
MQAMNPAPPIRATLHRWSDIPLENLTPLLDRRLVTGERVMLAHAHLKRGCIVPMHRHVHEQFAYIVQGKVRFTLGEESGETMTLTPGEVVHLPSDLPHAAEALEDSLVLDVFSPPREDWIAKTDDYLRK